MPYTLPMTAADGYDAATTVTLDGDRYRIRMRWDDRTGLWYADLATGDGVAIADGRPVQPSWPVGSAGQHLPGMLLAIDGEGKGAFSADYFGTLYYYTADELAAIAAAAVTVPVVAVDVL